MDIVNVNYEDVGAVIVNTGAMTVVDCEERTILRSYV